MRFRAALAEHGAAVMDNIEGALRELERRIEAYIDRRVTTSNASLLALIAEHRDDVHEELEELGRRITEVHTRALRELTRLHDRRTPQ